MQSGVQNATLLTDIQANPTQTALEGLILDGDNVLYIEAEDIAESKSQIDTSITFFIKRQSSELLVIEDHSDPGAGQIYAELLQNLNINYDLVRLGENIPDFWEPTVGLWFALYDRIFWYSDGTEYDRLGENLLMEAAANEIQKYLNQGGKLFVSTRFPSSFNDPSTGALSPVFGFSPMDSLDTQFGQARPPDG